MRVMPPRHATVKTHKLLGVTIREDLKWNSHVDCIIAKAAKRLIG